jgi:hypothetical protein
MKKFPLTTLAAAMLAAPLGADAALVLSGYVDASYTYLSSAGLFTPGADDAGTGTGSGLGGFSRVYDREHNSFNLQSLSLVGDFDSGNGWGGFVQLDFGNDASVNESNSSYTTNAAPIVANEFNIQEALLKYKTGSWTFSGGKMATLAGAEVIESYQNWNFSRSILFGYAIPFTHTGVRAAFAPSTALTLFAGVNNGWDQLSEASVVPAASHRAADGKTLELGLAWAPSSTFGLNGAFYTGDETVGAGAGRRDLLDVVATFGPFGPWTFKANVDFGKQEDGISVGSDAKWTGIAGYANFQINPKWRVAGRLEQLDDKDGLRTGVRTGGSGQKWQEGTVTVAFAPNTNVELRAEARLDQSDVSDAFLKPDLTSTDDTQTSLALEGIVRF